MKKQTMKPLALCIGAAMTTSISTSALAGADQNPFGAASLSAGYMIDTFADAKAPEAKCGGDKAKAEGKCGEGKCGEKKAKEGKCGEGKCGEGKCGEKKAKEGKCGEGKCGEGKCGEKKDASKDGKK